jgi:hypothetical protein
MFDDHAVVRRQLLGLLVESLRDQGLVVIDVQQP